MAPKPETDLAQAFLTRSESVSEIAKGLRAHDAEGTTASIANLVVTLASDVPVLGRLAAEGARWAFAQSAYARLERVATEINSQLDQAAMERRIAESVAELVTARLAALDESRAKPRAVAASASQPPREHVRVDQVVVDEGATGVELSEPKGRDIDVTQRSVSGEGTVGVKL
jgi:hypothetical protein